jgi:plastocyanin
MKRKLVLITFALIGIAVFAGWWFLLRDDAPPPPDLESAIQIASAAQAATTTTNAVTVPSTTLTATSTTEVPTTIAPTSTTMELEPNEESDITGTWSVDKTIGSFGIDESTSSFVGFRIQEVLGRGIGEVTAVGRTPLVDGTINFVEGSLTKAEIIADLTELRTDRSMRDSKVQSALNTSTHPNAVFVLDETISINNSKIIDSTVPGSLTVNGLTNQIEVELQGQLVGQIMTVVGKFEVALSDYEVEAPSAPVVVSVEDTAIVEFQLFFIKATSADSTAAVVTTTTIDPLTIENVKQLNEYIAEATSFDQSDSDWLLPGNLDPSAGGAPGFTRYVFRQTSAGVVPTLVEGPIGPQFRCQDEDLPCSYLELKELLESNSLIPEEMGLSREELTKLVSELDLLSQFLEEHRDVNKACEKGYLSDRIQTANMGSHFIRADAFADGFNPGEPEIILYARADGILPSGALGQCRDGVWDGEPMVLVGSAFILPPTQKDNSHPEGFTGNLDNWHVHLNLCRGNSTGTDAFVPKEECEKLGGKFHETIGWMMHAWVNPEHDNELGVFSMWNPTIAPFGDTGSVEDRFLVQGENFPEGAKQSLVTNFAFEDEIEVEAGQSVYFNNSDSVPHTISAGTPDAPELEEFDSGVLNPGDNFQIDTSQPGSYPLFCALHPDMTALLIVN